MKPDKIFQRSSFRASEFEFNEEVAAVFDDMLMRSVPFYYSEEEIMSKYEVLENVLIPYLVYENLEMIYRNGFEVAETFFQWYNFAGFLCVKRPT